MVLGSLTLAQLQACGDISPLTPREAKPLQLGFERQRMFQTGYGSRVDQVTLSLAAPSLAAVPPPRVISLCTHSPGVSACSNVPSSKDTSQPGTPTLRPHLHLLTSPRQSRCEVLEVRASLANFTGTQVSP